jgi:hypothetical protein
MQPIVTGRRRVEAVLLVLVLCGLGACSDVVYIMSPYDRYDHNRARAVIFPALGEKSARLVDDAAYVPFGSARFPSGAFVPPTTAPDGLPAANLVPVFTGLPLPLSSESQDGGPSDRDDLVDFLGAGPLAGAGLRRAGVAGDLTVAVTARYAPILDLLSSADNLSAGRPRVIEWAESHGVRWTGRVRDSRQREDSISSLIALRHGAYWFVLIGLPDVAGFTRLVVVPVVPHEQNFGIKKPVIPVR